ncbi:MAG: NAD(P)/FAD-dependent oxidoreductase [Oscillatoria princeps RMCB-10]|jgi:predicted Rossmann fold flavoprotein|nr:NAD(P)/FAD-dependent oxidoreductase [Oscillatoria princeps RMCB-10]
MKIVVIGGGAAGFFGAITCAKTHPHTRVTLLEAGRKPLEKVRISGGGRCNVTHACFDAAVLAQNYPRGGKALRGPLTRFQPLDTVKWFESQGVKLKTEEDGRMFPTTDDSATIVNCLLRAALDAGVELRTGTPAVGVSYQDGINSVSAKDALLKSSPCFEIQLKTGEVKTGDRLLLATGSSPAGYQIAKSLGHAIEPPVPSLFTFNIRDERLRDLAGISVTNARVRLPEAKLEQTGPVLVTHWGLSGPAVLKLSSWGARFLHDCWYQTPLQVNWLPQYKPDELRQMLLAVKNQLPRREIASSCPVPLPRRLWERLVGAAGIAEETRWAEVSNKSLNQLVEELTQGKYQIAGKGVFKEEFVTCGGVSLKEVDFKTLESRLCPGLYFAGEILDIDAVTGGFNFQNAWTTGWIAGQAMGAQP